MTGNVIDLNSRRKNGDQFLGTITEDKFVELVNAIYPIGSLVTGVEYNRFPDNVRAAFDKDEERSRFIPNAWSGIYIKNRAIEV